MRDSLSEMLDRKIFWVFAVLTGIAILGAAMSRGVSINIQTDNPAFEEAMTQVKVIALRGWEKYVSFLVFLSVMASASALPTMLERGRADFYLSKPLSRQSLFLSKLFSVWLVYGLVVAISSILSYSTAGAIHHIFEPKIFLLLAVAGLQFMVWLTITFAAGLVSNSTSMAVISAFLIWILQLILVMRDGIKQFFDSPVASAAIDAVYYILPKTSQMADIGLALAMGEQIHDWMPLWSSLLFAAVALYATIFYFQRRDY